MTAGTLSSRRMRRAAPLPNWVRVSALIFSSIFSSGVLCVLLVWLILVRRVRLTRGRDRDLHRTPDGARRMENHDPATSITEVSPSPRQLAAPRRPGRVEANQ